MKKIENPTADDIAELQVRYIEALIELFESNKHKFGVSPEKKITIA